MNEIFDFLKTIFNEHSYRLYMIGGTSRDYLLGLEIKDYDFVTDATPLEIASFLNVDLTFAKYGATRYKYHDLKIDITTLRIEGDYKDSRHPSFIRFIKDIEKDYLRRDFTLNAIYIDEEYNVLDPSLMGVKDLKNKELRFIGDPLKRIKEDPLRILRGQRFAQIYGLKISPELDKLFLDNFYLLETINKDKISEEEAKLKKGLTKND